MDAVTSYHFLEHLHSSPKELFRSLVATLKPSGIFVLAGPNCVNLRKRITVPFGRGTWSSMDEWYESTPFRGHVREPSLGDLEYIARDLGLRDICFCGANFLGRSQPTRARRAIADVVDPALRRRPTLCSDIYAIGTR